MSAASDLRRDMLFDFAVARPEGFTVDDVVIVLDWDHATVNRAIRDLRHFLADVGDTVNLPCDPQGRGKRWVYRLVGTYDEIRGWTANRVVDAESRIRTMQAMLTSIVAATDGRTVPGRKARAMEVALRHLVENLNTIGDSDA